MDFALTENQEAIRDAIAKICEGFDDAYWLWKDREGGFPHDFHKALADAGWLGICVPAQILLTEVLLMSQTQSAMMRTGAVG